MRIRAGFALLLLLAVGVTALAQERLRNLGRTSSPAMIIEAIPDDQILITVYLPGQDPLPMTVKRVAGDQFLFNEPLRRENGWATRPVKKQAIGLDLNRR